MRVFQGWLSVFIIVVFAVMIVVSWKVYSHISQSAAHDMLRLQLRYACDQIDQTRKNLETVTEQSHHTALIKTRAFARMIEADPSIIKKADELEKIRKLLEVDELHISDEKGVLIASQPMEKKYIDYDMNSQEQSRIFMPALTDKKFAFVQPLQKSGASGSLFQYVGVARQDQPGIIQIAYTSQRIAEAEKVADVNFIAKGFRIGRSGELTIQKAQNTDIFLAPDEELFRNRKDRHGKDCTTLTIGHNGYLLTGTLPNVEIYLPRDSVVRVLIIANILFFVVIFFIISILLQRIVISKIQKINLSLARITGGDLEEQVQIFGPKEFEELASGINIMVSSLKDAIAHEKKRLDYEMELGYSVQRSV